MHSLRHLRPAAARRAQTAASATAAAADSMPSSATGSDSAPSCRASTAAATALTQVSQLRRDARALCSGALAGRAVPSSPVRVATRAEQAKNLYHSILNRMAQSLRFERGRLRSTALRGSGCTKAP